MRASLSTVLLWVVMLPQVALADGLRSVDRATSGGSRSGGSSSGGGSGGGSGSSWSSSDGTDDDAGFWLLFVMYTFGSPWSIPRTFFDDPTLQGYAPYPFFGGPGLLRRRSEDGSTIARKVAIALDAETGYMLQGVVPSGLALRVMMPYRLELDARFSGLTDVRERPAEVASAGTAHLTYRFAQGQRYDFRTGLGVRMFQLDELRLGFDLWYGIDTYLGPCVAWRIELHMGSAGDAFVGQVRTTVGAMLGRFELYAGYDHTAYISEASTAALGGPIAGLRAWF